MEAGKNMDTAQLQQEVERLRNQLDASEVSRAGDVAELALAKRLQREAESERDAMAKTLTSYEIMHENMVFTNKTLVDVAEEGEAQRSDLEAKLLENEAKLLENERATKAKLLENELAAEAKLLEVKRTTTETVMAKMREAAFQASVLKECSLETELAGERIYAEKLARQLKSCHDVLQKHSVIEPAQAVSEYNKSIKEMLELARAGASLEPVGMPLTALRQDALRVIAEGKKVLRDVPTCRGEEDAAAGDATLESAASRGGPSSA